MSGGPKPGKDHRSEMRSDPQSEAIHTLHLRGLPTSLVIDPDGQIVGKVEGGADWGSDQLRAALTKLLPVSSPTS